MVGIVQELEEYGAEAFGYDPVVPEKELQRLGLKPVLETFRDSGQSYDALILAVPHRKFREKPIEAYKRLLHEEGCWWM